MIISWKHKGLKKFYETGDKSGIQAKHAKTIGLLLMQLYGASKPEDMNTPGNYYHKLKGELKDYYSVRVSANWRLIFQFSDQHALNVDLIDYH